MSIVLASPPLFSWSIGDCGNDELLPFAMTPPSTPAPPAPDERTAVDAALVRRMATGDKEALGQLYDRLSRPLLATACTVLNDATEAQDIVHDVFVVLWEKAAWFDSGRGSAFAWAVTLTRNRSIDRLRSRRRRAALLEQSVPSDLGYDTELRAESAGEGAAAGDDAVAVRAAVAALPTEQKHALELAFFSGLTQQEISDRLKEPLGTIKARIRRGLIRLRDTLPVRL